MPAKKTADQKPAKRVTVEAVKNDNQTWKVQGKTMEPGDTAEVTERQAARLKERGLVK